MLIFPAPTIDSKASVNIKMTSALLLFAPIETTSSLPSLDNVKSPTKSTGTVSAISVLTSVITSGSAANVIPWFKLTRKLVASAVRPSIPINPAKPASACKLVKLRLASA